jgi:hypothetical protein
MFLLNLVGSLIYNDNDNDNTKWIAFIYNSIDISNITDIAIL